MKPLEKLPAATAAEATSTIAIAVIDTARAPRFERRHLPGNILKQAIQRTGGEQTAYGSDGAIAIRTGTVLLTKSASAGAYTLAAPSTAQAGTRLRIINTTARAHVITATDLLEDGVTGGAKDTATFGAFAGAALELEAFGGKWYVVSRNVCTIAAV